MAPRKFRNDHSTQYILFTTKLEACAKETTKRKEQCKTLILWCVKKNCINFRGLAATKYNWFIEESESDESGSDSRLLFLQGCIIPTGWYYSYRMVLFLEGGIFRTGWYYSDRIVLFLQGCIIPTGWYYSYTMVLFLKDGIIPAGWYCSYRMILLRQGAIIPTWLYYSYSVVLFLQDGIIPIGWYC